MILGEKNPYDEKKRVNILLTDVQHTRCDSMKAVINANPKSSGLFENASRMLIDHLECTPALQTSPRTISDVKTGDNGAGKGKGKGSGKRHGQASRGNKKKPYKDPDHVLDRPMVDRYKSKFKKLYFYVKEAGFAPNNIYLKFGPEEKTAMWELCQERDTPGWKEPVDPSIASLTRQVAEMSQQLKDSTHGRKRDTEETTMGMSDGDSNLSSLGASRKSAASNKSRNVCGHHRSDSY